MSDIEKELVEATGLKSKSGEKREKYLNRLIVATNKLPDSDWEELSEEAQKWVNAGAKAIDDGSAKDIEDFPDEEADELEEDEEVEEEDEAESEEDEEEEEDEKPKKKAKGKAKEKAKGKDKSASSKANGKAKGKKKAKSDDDEDEEEDEKPKKKKAGRPANDGPISGVKVELKKLLIKDPKMPVDDLQEKLEKGGVTVSRLTVSAIRAEFRHSLKVLKQEGVLDLGA